jgi:hypothetical protein
MAYGLLPAARSPVDTVWRALGVSFVDDSRRVLRAEPGDHQFLDRASRLFIQKIEVEAGRFIEHLQQLPFEWPELLDVTRGRSEETVEPRRALLPDQRE